MWFRKMTRRSFLGGAGLFALATAAPASAAPRKRQGPLTVEAGGYLFSETGFRLVTEGM
jgi:hypothetical protein